MAGPTYADTEDLALYGLPAATLVGAALPQQQAALSSASSKVASYLRSVYIMPLTTWGDDIKMAVCKIAAYTLLAGPIGFDPSNPGDASVKDQHDEAIRWLKDVAKKIATPDGVVDSSGKDDDSRMEPVTAQASIGGTDTSVSPFPSRRGF